MYLFGSTLLWNDFGPTVARKCKDTGGGFISSSWFFQMRFVPDMENVKGAKLAKRVPNQIYQAATYAPTSSYERLRLEQFADSKDCLNVYFNWMVTLNCQSNSNHIKEIHDVLSWTYMNSNWGSSYHLISSSSSSSSSSSWWWWYVERGGILECLE